MKQMLQDLGYALRTFRRAPGFAAVTILTLALGIGATTAVFSVAEAVLLRPLPFADQQRLTVLWESAKKRQFGLIETSYADYRDWRDQSKSFTQLAALNSSNAGMNLTGVGEPIQVDAAPVTHNFFTVLGVKPLLGRTFLPEDDRFGAGHVVVLSQQIWQDQFGGDPHILGRQVHLDDQSYTVVGVLPSLFKYPSSARLWVPLVPFLGPEGTELRIYRVLKAIGRLQPGVSVEKAQAEMRVIADGLEKRYPKFNEGFTASVRPLTEEIVGDSRPALLILLTGVFFLLLIAVANVANLLLARTLERKHEISIRAALGADRGRVMRQLLTEAVTLGLLGSGAGLLLASLGIRLLRSVAPASIPRLDEVRLDPPTLLFTLLVFLLAIAVFGIAPALEAGRGDLHAPLKEGGKRAFGSARSSRLRRLLVRMEVSLALVLLIGAGLMVQSMLQLKRINPGFTSANVLTARIRLPEKTYPEIRQRQMFFDRLREKAATLPGVVSAATVLTRPLDDSVVWEMPIAREGQSWDELLANPLTNFEAISPGYFQTLNIRLLQGRDFDAHDSEDSPLVAIVSKGLAATYWPGQNPLGKRVRRIFSDQVTPWITIVGVVNDVRYRSWDRSMPDFYLPTKQNPLAQYMPYQDLVLRTSVDPSTLARPLRGAVYSIDPKQAVASIATLDSLVDRALASSRFTLLLMGVFGALALCLAAVGIYGLLSYTVAQRSREIGLRMALGARKQEILWMVIGQGLKLTASGLAVGIAAAFVLTRFMANLLYGVSILDPLTFISVPVFLAAIALCATCLPAVRATRADPIKVLRYD